MTIGFPKPSHKRVSPSQKELGDISPAVDKELKERSLGLCELCGKALATERAHLTGRGHLDHKTKVTDLMHLCIKCHRWFDGNEDGIRAKRFIARAINTVLQNVSE